MNDVEAQLRKCESILESVSSAINERLKVLDRSFSSLVLKRESGERRLLKQASYVCTEIRDGYKTVSVQFDDVRIW